MTQDTDRHSQLIGIPPGYAGHEDRKDIQDSVRYEDKPFFFEFDEGEMANRHMRSAISDPELLPGNIPGVIFPGESS